MNWKDVIAMRDKPRTISELSDTQDILLDWNSTPGMELNKQEWRYVAQWRFGNNCKMTRNECQLLGAIYADDPYVVLNMFYPNLHLEIEDEEPIWIPPEIEELDYSLYSIQEEDQ